MGPRTYRQVIDLSKLNEMVSKGLVQRTAGTAGSPAPTEEICKWMEQITAGKKRISDEFLGQPVYNFLRGLFTGDSDVDETTKGMMEAFKKVGAVCLGGGATTTVTQGERNIDCEYGGFAAQPPAAADTQMLADLNIPGILFPSKFTTGPFTESCAGSLGLGLLLSEQRLTGDRLERAVFFDYGGTTKIHRVSVIDRELLPTADRGVGNDQLLAKDLDGSFQHAIDQWSYDYNTEGLVSKVEFRSQDCPFGTARLKNCGHFTLGYQGKQINSFEGYGVIDSESPKRLGGGRVTYLDEHGRIASIRGDFRTPDPTKNIESEMTFQYDDEKRLKEMLGRLRNLPGGVEATGTIRFSYDTNGRTTRVDVVAIQTNPSKTLGGGSIDITYREGPAGADPAKAELEKLIGVVHMPDMPPLNVKTSFFYEQAPPPPAGSQGSLEFSGESIQKLAELIWKITMEHLTVLHPEGILGLP